MNAKETFYGPLVMIITLLLFVQCSRMGDGGSAAPKESPTSTEEKVWQDSGLTWWKNIEDGKAESKRTGKPLFIFFTGYNTTSYRFEERDPFPHEPIHTALKSGFVLSKLYTDRVTDPSNQANRKLMLEMIDSQVLPAFVILSADGKSQRVLPYTRDFDEFLGQLTKA